MHKKYIVANWKCNQTIKEIITWLNIVGPQTLKASANLEIVVAPVFLHLEFFKREINRKGYKIQLAGQNISPFSFGAYTGEVCATQLKEYASFVIIGHSERKKFFNEDETMVNLKIKQALDNHLLPVVCVAGGSGFDSQLNEMVANINEENIAKIIFMYEPPSAISKQVGPIGLGEAAPLEEVLVTVRNIKNKFPANLIFYGGSVKASNIKNFIKQEEIDGVLIGSASLNADEFVKIILNIN